MQVLVVEAHEAELDPLELAFRHIGFGGGKAHVADFLPVRVGGRTLADAGDLQQRLAQIVGRRGWAGADAKRAGRAKRGRAEKHAAAARLQLHKMIIDLLFHH